MGSARDLHTGKPIPGGKGLRLLFPGDEQSVRTALQTAMGAFRAMDLGPDYRGVIEIVLAEVLNNVVEHAYAEHGRGVIEVEVDRLTDALAFCIRDDGHPMPDGEMPDGNPHDLDVQLEAMPEGGFGWFLIRELTDGLTYRRVGNRNELRFNVKLDASNLRH